MNTTCFCAALMFAALQTTAAQDTSCGIVWYPPIQISPGVEGVDESIPSLAVQGDIVHITWANGSQKFPYRRSINGGLTFEPIRELAPDTTILASKCILTGTSQWIGGLWVSRPDDKGWIVRSADSGASWSTAQMVVDSLSGWLDCFCEQDTIGIIIASDRRYRKVILSTDRGGSWAVRPPEIIGNDPRAAIFSGAVHLVTGWLFDSSGVHSEFVVQYRRSIDLGDTWSDSVNLSTMSSWAGEPSIAADVESSTVLTAWKDTKYGCLTLTGCSILGRWSSNAGNSFMQEERFDTQPAGYNTRVAVCGSIMAISWKDDQPGAPSYIRISMDKGAIWCPAYPLTMGRIDALELSTGKVHVAWTEPIGGGSGRRRVYYRRGLLLPTHVSEERPIPPPFATLSQNYPNPFNPQTKIKLEVLTRSRVLLLVYDLIGREIATLVNDTREPGSYEIPWSAGSCASGVYYYKLTVQSQRLGSHTVIKKMVLMR